VNISASQNQLDRNS